MSDILKSIEIFRGAKEKLCAGAKGSTPVTLTPEECREISTHMEWLSNERESLWSSLAAYSDD